MGGLGGSIGENWLVSCSFLVDCCMGENGGGGVLVVHLVLSVLCTGIPVLICKGICVGPASSRSNDPSEGTLLGSSLEMSPLG